MKSRFDLPGLAGFVNASLWLENICGGRLTVSTYAYPVLHNKYNIYIHFYKLRAARRGRCRTKTARRAVRRLIIHAHAQGTLSSFCRDVHRCMDPRHTWTNSNNSNATNTSSTSTNTNTDTNINVNAIDYSGSTLLSRDVTSQQSSAEPDRGALKLSGLIDYICTHTYALHWRVNIVGSLSSSLRIHPSIYLCNTYAHQNCQE